jgi:hypothetical protein
MMMMLPAGIQLNVVVYLGSNLASTDLQPSTHLPQTTEEKTGIVFFALLAAGSDLNTMFGPLIYDIFS